MPRWSLLKVQTVARSRALNVANRAIGFATDAARSRLEGQGKWPPVFLIGPPRSGSTLVMQVLTDAFEVGYLSNHNCHWFGDPALAERFLNFSERRERSDYTSSHGRTSRADGPAECGAWWYRFFRREPAYVRLSEVEPRKMAAFRQSIVALEKAIGNPLIFKNLYASLRLEPITHYLPDALFVVVERDWVATAQSILKGRKDALGSYEHWWSVPPPNVSELSCLPPVQQVVGQIEAIHHLIDRDFERLGAQKRTFRLSYEEFCKDVPGTLALFNDFMRTRGVELKPRFEVPASFHVDNERKIPRAMYDDLVAHVRERQAESNSVCLEDPA